MVLSQVILIKQLIKLCVLGEKAKVQAAWAGEEFAYLEKVVLLLGTIETEEELVRKGLEGNPLSLFPKGSQKESWPILRTRRGKADSGCQFLFLYILNIWVSQPRNKTFPLLFYGIRLVIGPVKHNAGKLVIIVVY